MLENKGNDVPGKFTSSRNPFLGFTFFTLLFLSAVIGAAYHYLTIPIPEPLPALVAEPARLDFGKVKPAYHNGIIKLKNQSKNRVLLLM